MKSFYLLRPYFKENRFLIIYGLFCLIIVDLLQLLIPRIIKMAVDDITNMQINAQRLLILAGYIVLMAIFIGIFRYGWRRCLIGLSRKIEEGLRNQVFSHIQKLSAHFFLEHKTGDLMAHATNDIQNIRMAAGMGLVALNDAIFLGSLAIVFMLVINVKLTLFSILPMPLIIVATKFFGKKIHKSYRDVQGSFSKLTESIRESFSGFQFIKSHTIEHVALARTAYKSQDYIDNNIRLVLTTGTFHPLMHMFSNLSLVIIILYGGIQALSFHLSAGDLVAFISYMGMLTWPMMAIGWVTNLVQRGAASLERIDAILKTVPEIKTSDHAKKTAAHKGDLSVKNISFAYPNIADIMVTKTMIKNISFHIKPGEMLGIIGPPGSGKSTLAHLIPRIFDPLSGEIRLDGQKIQEIDVACLRQAITFVPQEAFLFSGSIYDNIQLGNPAINRTEIEAACQFAALSETIDKMPKGLDTIIGERGVRLSGGQKQRVCIARAFVQNAPILILDDPISQVDYDTSQKIIESIYKLKGTKTIILISHRISAIKAADHILVLKNGEITESGNHLFLVQQNGYYAQTHEIQKLETLTYEI